MPPTAGVRALSLDGGGVKGIIPLMMLQSLEKEMQSLGAPIHEYFDFVAGTSAGGLIAIGVFLMGWSTDEGIRKFEAIASKMFRTPPRTSFSLKRLHDFVIAVLRDWKHDASAIEEAFTSDADMEIKMFNPLVTDTKVAVTANTTTATKPEPCIFSNYNHVTEKTGDHAYTVVRAERPDCDVSLAQAATCTSAAPLFFKPVTLKQLGTFQDGGLRHNNPIRICKWEIARLWPEKPVPDFALSVGTGKTAPVLSIGTVPPRRMSLSRVFDSFMESMDGERIWTEFCNSLSDDERQRYHRVNVPLSRPEPVLDDFAAIEKLKDASSRIVKEKVHTSSMVDMVIASMFYFEFDELPTWEANSWSCVGSILCRMQLPAQGRRVLYDRLKQSAAYFLVFGTPVAAYTDNRDQHMRPFRRQVRFSLSNLDDQVRITIGGITTRHMRISGLPRSAQDLLALQRLHAPFGCATHFSAEKPLPRLPAKRKRA